MRRRKNKKPSWNEAFINKGGKINSRSVNELMGKLNNAENDYDPALQSAKSKVFAGVWIQTAGIFLEAIGVTEELHINMDRADPDELEDFGTEKQAVAGVWLQAIGTLIIALGFTQELQPDERQQIQGRKLGIIGSWFEAFGSAIEAMAETVLLREDLDLDEPF